MRQIASAFLRYSQKAQIVRRRINDKEPVSDVAETS